MQWLISDEGQESIAALRGVDPLRARAQLPHLSDQQVAAALTQAQHKPRDFPLPLVTVDGIQQATAIEVARRRAERIAASGATRVVDAGCGIGVDAWAFQQAGLTVVAYEADQHTADIARANLPGVDVVTADVTTAELPPGVLYVDPARRRTHHDIAGRPVRINDPNQWSPPWPWVLAQATDRPVVARIRPGMRELPAGAEWHCSSMGRRLVDATVWFGELANTDRRASVHDELWHELVGPAESTAVGAAGAYIVDPDPAIVRSGLVTNAADLADGWLLDEHLAFFTCESVPPPWLGRSMRVVQATTLKDAATDARRLGMRGVTVWARGFPSPPKVGIREHPDGILVLARVGDKRVTRAWLGIAS